MNEHPIVTSAVQLISCLSLIASKEMTVSVADTEKYIKNISTETLNLGIKPGDPIKPGSIADITLREGTRQIQRIPKEIFGVPFIGVGVPLKDEEGKIVGLILTGTPINDQEDVREMAQNLAVTGQQISAATENIAVHSQELSVTTEQVARQTAIMRNNVQRLDDVLKVIKGVTDRTNILGINAAIEAARAGEQGKGFIVVAEEIRKLSANTNSSTKVISDTLLGIQEQLIDISGKIDELFGLFQEQAAGTQEIASSTKEVENMSLTLLRLAEQLV